MSMFEVYWHYSLAFIFLLRGWRTLLVYLIYWWTNDSPIQNDQTDLWGQPSLFVEPLPPKICSANKVNQREGGMQITKGSVAQSWEVKSLSE
jgi:hypothetical protein